MRFHRLGQSEVEHLHHAVSSNFDVRRFQIAVNDSLLVRRFEGLRDLVRDPQRVIGRDRAARDAF